MRGGQPIDGVSKFFGFRYEAPGRLRLTLRPDLMNPAGLISGPVAFAMMDYAMGSALWMQIEPAEESIATLNISINYVASASEGDLVCFAEVDRRNRRAATLTGRVETEDGRLLAQAIGAFSIFPRKRST